jgi:hypothetical protein
MSADGNLGIVSSPDILTDRLIWSLCDTKAWRSYKVLVSFSLSYNHERLEPGADGRLYLSFPLPIVQFDCRISFSWFFWWYIGERGMHIL